jgi:hypothetical protein
MQAKIALLQAELPNIESATQYLTHSLHRCAGFEFWLPPTPEQLERLEAMSAGFARLSDLLIQRLFRLIDEIELVGTSTVLDRIYRAEKRGWGQASELIKIRELRNTIAHEYALDALPEIYSSLITSSSHLLHATQQAKHYANSLLQQHAAS